MLVILMGNDMIAKCLSHHIPVVLVAIVMSACTTVHKNFKPFVPSMSQGNSTLKIAVVLPKSLCAFYHDNGNLTAFYLGPVICRNVKLAANSAFSNPQFYSSIEKVDHEKSDAIVIIKPKRASAYSIRDSIPARVITTVALSLEFETTDKKRRYATTIYGDGLDRRTFGLADARYESSMQKCMDDLAGNIYKELTIAFNKGLKNIENSERILKLVSSYKKDRLTYSQYRDSRPDDWYIYALDEYVKYKYTRYSYIFDPVSDNYVTDVGGCMGNGFIRGPMVMVNDVAGMPSVRNFIKGDYYKGAIDWKTYWDRRHGVVPSLRPTTY